MKVGLSTSDLNFDMYIFLAQKKKYTPKRIQNEDTSISSTNCKKKYIVLYFKVR